MNQSGTAFLQIVKINKQERERREPLLTVNDGTFGFVVGDNDAAEIIMSVVCAFSAFVVFVVVFLKFVHEVVNQFFDLLFAPTIFSLVVMNRIFFRPQKVADGSIYSGYFFHSATLIFPLINFGNKLSRI